MISSYEYTFKLLLQMVLVNQDCIGNSSMFLESNRPLCSKSFENFKITKFKVYKVFDV